MGVKVADKISRLKNRQSPASRVESRLTASKKLLEDETIAKARALLKGAKGEKGDKGDKGDQGDQGPPGVDGRTPVAGIDFIIHHGRDGKDGKIGRDGITTIISGGDDATALLSAVIQYTGDLVTRIDYSDGQFKVLTYNVDSTINTIVWNRGVDVVTKTFVYDGAGNVTNVTVTIV